MILNLYYPIFALCYLGFEVLSQDLTKVRGENKIDISKYFKVYISHKDLFFLFLFYYKICLKERARSLGIVHLGLDVYVNFPLWVIILRLTK